MTKKIPAPPKKATASPCGLTVVDMEPQPDTTPSRDVRPQKDDQASVTAQQVITIANIRRRSMPSQLEELKRKVARLDPEGGSDNPFVQGLRMQIASLEKPRAENPMSNRETYHAGMRGPPVKPARSK